MFADGRTDCVLESRQTDDMLSRQIAQSCHLLPQSIEQLKWRLIKTRCEAVVECVAHFGHKFLLRVGRILQLNPRLLMPQSAQMNSDNYCKSAKFPRLRPQRYGSLDECELIINVHICAEIRLSWQSARL